MKTEIEHVLLKNRLFFHPVIKFNSLKEKIFHFDFSSANTEITASDIADTERFSRYVNKKLESQGAKFGIGGYDEDRVLYKRSKLFEPLDGSITAVAARSIHLGVDIWGPVGTEVFVPLGGMVHSFAFNDNFGDYGATIILQHQLDTIVFHTLYGHVSLADLAQLHPGQYISRGEKIAHFGKPSENGWWPPHLHLQVIGNMNLMDGDYPGVCTIQDRNRFLQNCPDPDLILNLARFSIAPTEKETQPAQ